MERNSSEDLKRKPAKNQSNFSGRAQVSRQNVRQRPQQNADSSAFDSSRDISSNSAQNGIDLMSRSSARMGKKKKSNKKLIMINVILSVVLVISSVTSVLAYAFNSKMLKDSAIDEDESNKDLKSVVTSVNENVVYFLVCGVDLSESLTDVIMVVCYDIANKEINVLQIPRDTYIGRSLDGQEKYYPTGKVNEVFRFPREGESKIKALMRCINDKFGLPIDHYATVTIQGTEKIIDAVGGVDIELDRTLKLVDDSRSPEQTKTFEKGKVHFDGQWGTAFMRHRKSYDQGDLGRVKAQRTFYAAFLKKLLTMGFSELANIASTCLNDVSTDLKLGQILGYVQEIKKLSLENINIMSVPGQSPTLAEARENVGLSYSYYSIHKQKYVDMINQYFRPYEEKLLTVNDISIPEIANSDSTGYDDFLQGGSLNEFDSEQPKTTASEDSSDSE